MTPPLDLSKFGFPPTNAIQGSVVHHHLDGQRLLILFAERHTLKPGIRLNLLNATRLYDQGLLSCVGVEGYVSPDEPFPRQDVKRLFDEQTAQGGDDEALIHGMLKSYPGDRKFVFWETLYLLRRSLRIKSVDDDSLVARLSTESMTRYRSEREAKISQLLRQSDLFVPHMEHKECSIKAKVELQEEQEFAEHPYNVKRDDTFIEQMFQLWNGVEAEKNKPAILNAGASHQYRIARRLHSDEKFRDVSYILIEQPESSWIEYNENKTRTFYPTF